MKIKGGGNLSGCAKLKGHKLLDFSGSWKMMAQKFWGTLNKGKAVVSNSFWFLYDGRGFLSRNVSIISWRYLNRRSELLIKIIEFSNTLIRWWSSVISECEFQMKFPILGVSTLFTEWRYLALLQSMVSTLSGIVRIFGNIAKWRKFEPWPSEKSRKIKD